MKRKIYIVITLLFSLILIGCSEAVVEYKVHTFNLRLLNRHSLVKNIDELEEQINEVKDYDIDNYLTSYINQLTSYGNKYFEDNYLVLANLTMGSGSTILSIDKLTISNDILKIKYKTKTPNIATSDVKAWNFIIEINKNENIKSIEPSINKNHEPLISSDKIHTSNENLYLEDKSLIINNYNEYLDYIDINEELIDIVKYDESYFTDNILILINYLEPITNNSLFIEKVFMNFDTLEVLVGRNYYNEGDTAIKYWSFIIEIKKEYNFTNLNIITNNYEKDNEGVPIRFELITGVTAEPVIEEYIIKEQLNSSNHDLSHLFSYAFTYDEYLAKLDAFYELAKEDYNNHFRTKEEVKAELNEKFDEEFFEERIIIAYQKTEGNISPNWVDEVLLKDNTITLKVNRKEGNLEALSYWYYEVSILKADINNVNKIELTISTLEYKYNSEDISPAPLKSITIAANSYGYNNVYEFSSEVNYQYLENTYGITSSTNFYVIESLEAYLDIVKRLTNIDLEVNDDPGRYVYIFRTRTAYSQSYIKSNYLFLGEDIGIKYPYKDLPGDQALFGVIDIIRIKYNLYKDRTSEYKFIELIY